MWPTLRAELKYNTVAIGLFAILMTLAIWGAIAKEGGNVYAVVTNSSIILLFAHILIVHKRKKELFVRRAAMLPQSLSSASWSRFLAVGVLQAIVLAVWFSMYLIFRMPEDSGAIWKLLSSNALLMIVVVMTVAEKDSCSWSDWRDPGRLLFNVSMGLLAGIALFLSFANMGSYVLFHLDSDSRFILGYTNFLQTPMGALVTNLAFVITLIVVHVLYQRRAQYLK